MDDVMDALLHVILERRGVKFFDAEKVA